MRFKNIFFACLLLVSVLFTAASSADSISKAEAGKRHVFYQRALYEATEAMAGMQVTLKKLTVTSSKALETEYLSKITGYASSIQNSLSTLPIGVSEINETMKLVNQAGDFSLSALKKLSKGGALTQSDREAIKSLLDASTHLSIALSEVTEAFSKGESVFRDTGSTASDGFQTLTHPKEEYPTLLYDGPFSDSMLNRRMKGLGENEVTMEEAKSAVSEFIGAEENEIRFLQETGGDERTYVFEILDGNAEAAVTKRGGKVLYLLSDTGARNEKLTAEDCILTAKAFLKEKGFGEMHAGYYQKYAGIATVNLAPVENGIILYPDLIKIGVDMETGEIVGAEFTNYLMNHVKRELNAINRPTEDIQYESMEVLSVRPALIPMDTGEKLTFEIHLKDEANEYLIYRDMETNDEIIIYEVVHTPGGTIVQ